MVVLQRQNADTTKESQRTAPSNSLCTWAEKFSPLHRPLVPAPKPMDAEAKLRSEWKARRKEVSIWDRSGRKNFRQTIRASVEPYVAEHDQWALRGTARQQLLADEWWASLLQGHPPVLASVLVTAFSDNPAPVVVAEVESSHAVLLLRLPDVSVLPDRKANITPSGRLSTKPWSKTELNQVYAQLLAIHLLATLRESWAVAPSLTSIRVIGLGGPGASEDVIFDVECARDSDPDDPDGSQTAGWLERQEAGLRRAGRTREVSKWPTSAWPPGLGGWLRSPQTQIVTAPWTQPVPLPADPEPTYARPSVPPVNRPKPAHSQPKPIKRDRANKPAAPSQPIGPARVGPVLAFLASFFVPGLGSLLNRRRIGILILASWVASFVLVGVTTGVVANVGVLILMGCWIWGWVDAIIGGRNRPRQHGAHSAQSSL